MAYLNNQDQLSYILYFSKTRTINARKARRDVDV